MSANIHTAILDVMRQVGYVQKERSPGLNYSYAGEAALIQALRPAMLEAGIYSHILEVEAERNEYESSRGTAMTSTLIRGKVRFVHAPSDTHIDVVAMGEGADAGDKSSPKAMTGLLKYALRQTFLIETGDDPDRERPEDEHGGKKEGGNSKPRSDKKQKKSDRPYTPELLREKLHERAQAHEGKSASDAQFGLAMGMLNEAFAGDEHSDEKRHSVLAYLLDVDSGKEMNGCEVLALLDWIKAEKDSGGAYAPDPMMVKEAHAVVKERMKELGQDELL